MTRRRNPPKQKLLPLFNLSHQTRLVVQGVLGLLYLLYAAVWLFSARDDRRYRALHVALAAGFLVAAVGQIPIVFVLARRRRRERRAKP